MRKIRSIVSLTLALVLCLSLCVTASAGEVALAEAVHITKVLKIADGITTPEAEFTFTFTGDPDNSTGLQSNDDIPAIAAKTLTYSADITDSDDDDVISLVTDDILDDAVYTHAGIYAYTVKETANTYSAGEGETMTYDPAVYTLRVYVVNGEDGVEVKGATVEKETSSDPSDPSETGTKVTTTDDGAGSDGEQSKDASDEDNKDSTSKTQYGSNGFKFENTYTKVSSGENGESLVVSKTVTGDYGDKTKLFTYTVKVTAPETAHEGAGFTYNWTENGEPASDADVSGVYGTAFEVKLAHEDELTLKGVLAGSTYEVEEAAYADYTASVVYTGVSEDGTAVEVVNNDDNKILAVSDMLREDGDSADYTNEYDKDKTVTPPTGITINNLPFILLIAVSVLFLFFVVFKRRRTEK